MCACQRGRRFQRTSADNPEIVARMKRVFRLIRRGNAGGTECFRHGIAIADARKPQRPRWCPVFMPKRAGPDFVNGVRESRYVHASGP